MGKACFTGDPNIHTYIHTYDKDLVFMVIRDGVQIIQLIELDDVTKPFVLEPCFQILQECAIISLLVGTDNSAVAK